MDKLKASGLRPQVQADDLEQAGYVGLIKSLMAFDGGIDLTARLSKHIKTYIVCEIKAELKHWPRYSDNKHPKMSRVPWEALFDEDGEPLV